MDNIFKVLSGILYAVVPIAFFGSMVVAVLYFGYVGFMVWIFSWLSAVAVFAMLASTEEKQ